MGWGEVHEPATNARLLAEAANQIEEDGASICARSHAAEWPNCDEGVCVDRRVLIARLRKASTS